MLLEFTAASGLISRENGQIRARSATSEQTPSPVKPEEPREKDPPVNSSKVSTAVNSTPGRFNLNISVEVDMAEFSTWRPERIQAFFRGVAEVLAAKADVEKGAGSS